MGVLTKGLIAAGALAGGAPLAKTAYDTVQDKLRYDAMKERLSDSLPDIVMAGIGGALAGGSAGYAAGKLQKGTYNMLPKSDSNRETAQNMIRALTGRTGVEHTEPYKSVIKDRLSTDMNYYMKSKQVLPKSAQTPDFYGGMFDIDPDKALAETPGASFKHACYGDLKVIADKLAVSIPAAIATAGSLALGGHLFNKHVFQPWQEDNRKKLDIADSLSKYAVPAAAAAGALIGGGGGYLAGRKAGEEQKENLAQDLYNATASAHFSGEVGRRMVAYNRARSELANKYLDRGE